MGREYSAYSESIIATPDHGKNHCRFRQIQFSDHDATESPRAQLTAYLNAIGRNQFQQRKAKISAIKTHEEVAQHQQTVRQQILALIGGLPSYRGPLNTRTTGVLNHAD
jgi:hypothetical protein